MEDFKVVGKSVPKIDALEKVTGQAKYTTDIVVPRMLHAKILNSDVSKAQKLSGVKAVATGKDAPDEKMYMLKDRYVLAKNMVRFIGEPVAAVAATTIEIAQEALDLIEVEYEPLPAVFDVEEAMKPNPEVVVNTELTSRYFSPFYQGIVPEKAPIAEVAAERPNIISYYKIRKGDTDKGFKEADLIVEERYARPRIQHCCLEPNATIVRPELDGGITVWATTQTIYPEIGVICRLFNLPFSKVRLIAPHQGGGFGSRVEGLGASIHIAILLAQMARRPVKQVYTRDEVFIDGVTEIPFVIYLKDGVKKDGTLVAREVKLILNSGAYSGNMVIGAYNGGLAAGGTYRIPNFKLDSYVVYTNEPVSGPFRGYAANPTEWAIECHMDLVAEKLGMDPMQLRRKNILKEGEENGAGEITVNIQLEDSINKVLEQIRQKTVTPYDQEPWKKGIGFALVNKLTTGANWASSVIVKVYPDAMIEVRHSCLDIGQGCNTAVAQMAAEEFATSVDKIKVVSADSAITPPDHGTISNRVTWHVGNALRLACKDVKRQIFERASTVLMATPDNLVIEDGLIHKKGTIAGAIKVSDLYVKVPAMYVPKDGEFLGRGTYVTPVIPPDPETGLSKRMVAYYSWGACAVEVAVNLETGAVKVLRVAQCFDMGQPINPKICEGQTEGGIGMGIGSALYEELVMEDGIVVNPNFVDYKLPSIMEIPLSDIKPMAATTVPHKEGPFGAKGFAEGGLLPMPPAIANAIANAIGVRITELPITREKVLAAMERRGARTGK
ncbi:xanthine dehydrogenase family protein molybdopterin-binding subunit [Chloroflexota bacterium]